MDNPQNQNLSANISKTTNLPDESGLPANFSLTLTETKHWTLIAVSTIGTGHIHKQLPNEDAVCLTAYGNSAIAVIADGVSDSKAAHSGYGARRAVRTCAPAIARGLAANLDPEQAIAEAFAAVHLDLVALTGKDFWGTYACTLAAAIITDTAITVGHTGDSCLYASDGKRLSRVASGPVHSGPITIVEPTWRKGFTTQHLDKPYIKACVLATDGASDFFNQPGPTGAPQPRLEVVESLSGFIDKNPNPITRAAGVVRLMAKSDYTQLDDRSLVFALRKD